MIGLNFPIVRVFISLSVAELTISPDLPESAGITSGKLISFLIIWLLQFPFAFVHPSKMSTVFMVKSVLAPIGLIATMIWAVVSIFRLLFNSVVAYHVLGLQSWR